MTARKEPAAGAGTMARMYRHILVPTDGSRASERAAQAAAALARRLGARLTALHVVAPLDDSPLSGWVHGDGAFGVRLGGALERRGILFVEAVREIARRAGLACECALARGRSPSAAIVREARARGCDLIVMASHGPRGTAGMAGSETLKVVALGGIPVLAHHAGAELRGTRRAAEDLRRP